MIKEEERPQVFASLITELRWVATTLLLPLEDEEEEEEEEENGDDDEKLFPLYSAGAAYLVRFGTKCRCAVFMEF